MPLSNQFITTNISIMERSLILGALLITRKKFGLMAERSGFARIFGTLCNESGTRTKHEQYGSMRSQSARLI